MINTDYGHAVITVNGVEHSLTPSLINISKIGSPTYIVEAFDLLNWRPLPNDTFVHYAPHEHYESNIKFVEAFGVACSILNCCELDKSVTGSVVQSRQSKDPCILKGVMPIEVVFTLAWHCLRFGVIGSTQAASNNGVKKKAVAKFNAHKFMISAMQNFGLTLTESQNLTMTQLMLMIDSQSGADEKDEAIAESESLLEWFKENNEVH